MKIITLEEGLNVYHFNKEAKGEFVSYNIVVLEKDNECFIIDTAFRRHFNQLLDDLKRKGKKITHAAITHFHRDHIGGIPKIRDAKIYGSKNAEITLKKVFKQNDYSHYMPNILIDEEVITFGRFKIQLVLNIGHSVDGMLVIVNGKYLYVGDEMIYDLKGKELLPFASEGNIIAHIASLNRIISYGAKGVIIPAHGPILQDNKYFILDIKRRIMFLKYKYQNPNKNHLDFQKETGIEFLGIEWYKNNV